MVSNGGEHIDSPGSGGVSGKVMMGQPKALEAMTGLVTVRKGFIHDCMGFITEARQMVDERIWCTIVTC